MKMKADINLFNHPLYSTKFFLISFIIFFHHVSCAQDGGIVKDSQQLISFKNSLLNPNELLTWRPTISPCNFHGVSCKNSRVSSIDLSNYNLNVDFSKVAVFLLSLPYLESLVLKNANVTGSVSSVSSDSCGGSLSSLDLAENFISGPVSDVKALGVCSNLSFLNLSKNSMDYAVEDGGSKGSVLGALQVLDLSYNNISGDNVVSWFLSSAFPGLEYLSLKGNRVGGGLSEFNFKNLMYLDLSMNNMSSRFPLFSDCSSLQHLDLSFNKLYDDVGSSISSCKKLSFLNLMSNNLTGTFPSLPSGSIQYLYLQGNHFQGTLPPDVSGLCTTLVELDVSVNNFTGSLPQDLGSCSSLEILRVSGNGFSGEFPIDIFLNLSSLKTLNMSFNYFHGELPESLSKMVTLETLDMSSNNLTGSVPSGLCLDTGNSFKVLYLQNNMLTGPIPGSLSNCSSLESLDLSFNFLTGTIPPSLGSLAKLKDLVMWLNQLHGEIPQEFANLWNLQNLILDFNYLSGSIPPGLGNCSKLNWISLSDNELTGEIPPSLGGLTDLAILKLGNNSLSGNIPTQLGDCQSLIWLDLNTNYLTGVIPPALFKQSGYIALALLTGNSYAYIKNDGSKQCHGAGNLLEFGGIRREQLDRISTRHPCNFTRVYRGITQPTFNHNGSMIFLDLSYNGLVGSIPKELGSMYYLQILNLKHNGLSGPIPEELGGLKNVAILDLSYNRLNGSIPGSLTGFTLLVDIDLSNNYLSGTIPESAPFDTFPDYRFANNSGLCGYPLPACGLDPAMGREPSRRTRRRRAELIGSVAVGLLAALFCIFGFLIIILEAKKKKKQRQKEAALSAYIENHSNSNSTWKLMSIREAMSINLSTFEKPLKTLTFADLLEATNGFHDDFLVGSGGFGDVYRAQLKDGTVVAVKKLIHVSGQGDREFTAEMETIGKVKHRNLVPLLGYCRVGEERLLVYEYMKHGSLDDVLHDRNQTGLKLGWPARRNIAVGAARGLAFLHHNCTPRIIHRDMKSSNVLIDEELEARVSDFGMARLVSVVDTHLSVSTLAGTPGYVPPEYYQSFRCSTKGDVYSYGVFLLELLTGKKPTDLEDFGDDNNILGWVKERAKTRIMDVFDPVLLGDDPGLVIELLQHLKVACACLDDRPSKRPNMIQVMAMFKEIQAGSGLGSRASSVVDECGF